MTIETLPLSLPSKVIHNTGTAELIELAIGRGEARFSAGGALAVETGVHTGRSVQDKFTVRDASTEKVVWWDNNKPMSPEQFELLWADFQAHARTRELFVQDLFAGADPAHRLNARIFLEYAWHALFIRHLLRRPKASELANFAPQFTVINLPSFKADPKKYGVRSETVIACNFAKRLVLRGDLGRVRAAAARAQLDAIRQPLRERWHRGEAKGQNQEERLVAPRHQDPPLDVRAPRKSKSRDQGEQRLTHLAAEVEDPLRR
jgi:ATP-dependent phosphoenolpyruvate carboxykinase